jgi:putative transposase
MPQSLAKVHVHLIFSTKGRERWITDKVRESLHSYMATVLKNVDCHVVLINSVEDHVHLLIDLGRKVSVSGAVQEVKTASSKWMKTQGTSGFAWQAGYGAFAVSESNVDAVRDYIAKQQEHIGRKRFRRSIARFWSGTG